MRWISFLLLVLALGCGVAEQGRIETNMDHTAPGFDLALARYMVDRETDIVSDTLAFQGWVGLQYVEADTMVVLPMEDCEDGTYPYWGGRCWVVEWTMPTGRRIVWAIDTSSGEIVARFPPWIPERSPSYLDSVVVED